MHYIEVKNVSKSFGGKAILQDVSLSIEQGTAVGLVGANGSGKSVLFKILCGFEKPDQGSVYVRGKQLGKNGRDFPESLGVFINSPGFIGIYSGFQNLKFLAEEGKIEQPYVPEECTHNAHMYYIKVHDIKVRTRLLKYLREKEICSVFHYVPLHSAPAGKKFGRFSGEDVYTTKESERLMRLPMFYNLDMEDAKKVVDAIASFDGF